MSIQLNDTFVNEAAQELFQNGLNRIGEIRNITLRYYPETEVQRITTAIRVRYESAMQHIGLSSTDTFRSIVRNSIVHLQQPSTPSQPQGVIQAIANTASNIIVPQTSSQSSSSTTAQSSVTPSIPEGTLPVRTTFVPLSPPQGILPMMPPAVQAIIGANYVENFRDVVAFISLLPLENQTRAFCSMMNPTQAAWADVNCRNASFIIIYHILRQPQFSVADEHTNTALTAIFNDIFPQMRHLSEVIAAFRPALCKLRNVMRYLSYSGYKTLTNAQLQKLCQVWLNLQNIDVSDCRKINNVGARAIATHCRQLQHVNVSHTRITNDGVRDLASCPLQSLDVGHCSIDNDVLRDLAQSRPQLQSLDLAGCRNIDNAGLAHLANLNQLRSLHFGGNRNIDNAGLAHLANLILLQSLNLAGCPNIGDAGLAHLVNLEQLQSLNLAGGDNITDAGLAHLANLTLLQSLDLAGCSNIGDVGLAHLANLAQLRSLSLSLAHISDAGLVHLERLTKLQHLILDTCRGITAAGIARLVRLGHLAGQGELRSLNVRGCNISHAERANLSNLFRNVGVSVLG